MKTIRYLCKRCKGLITLSVNKVRLRAEPRGKLAAVCVVRYLTPLRSNTLQTYGNSIVQLQGVTDNGGQV